MMGAHPSAIPLARSSGLEGFAERPRVSPAFGTLRLRAGRKAEMSQSNDMRGLSVAVLPFLVAIVEDALG